MKFLFENGSIHYKNLKKETKILPIELYYELIKFLPLNFKWIKLRISLIFDIFLLKNQRQWVICIKKIIEPFKDKLIGFITVRLADFLQQNVNSIESYQVFYAKLTHVFDVFFNFYSLFPQNDVNFNNIFHGLIGEWQAINVQPGLNGLINEMNIRLELLERIASLIFDVDDQFLLTFDNQILKTVQTNLNTILRQLNSVLIVRISAFRGVLNNLIIVFNNLLGLNLLNTEVINPKLVKIWKVLNHLSSELSDKDQPFKNIFTGFLYQWCAIVDVPGPEGLMNNTIAKTATIRDLANTLNNLNRDILLRVETSLLMKTKKDVYKIVKEIENI